MKHDTYKRHFSGHYAKAIKLISKYISVEKMGLMTDSDIEKEVNKRFIAIQIGDDWLLIDREKEEEFNDIALFIGR